MARQDFDIDDGTGAQVLADLNAVFDAILSTNSGSGTPSYAVTGTMFLDGNNLKIKASNGITTIGDITQANLGFMTAGGTTMTGQLSLQRSNQSASAPALDFGDTDTGLYSESSTTTVDITVDGTRRATFNTDGLALNSTRFLQFAHTNGTLNLKQVVPSSGAGTKTINIPHQNGTLLTQEDFGTNSSVTTMSGISEIFRENNTSQLNISGGSGSALGANIQLNGGARSSQSDFIQLRENNIPMLTMTEVGKFLMGRNNVTPIGNAVFQVTGSDSADTSGMPFITFRHTGDVSDDEIVGGFDAGVGTNDIAHVFARRDAQGLTAGKLTFATQPSGGSNTTRMIITSVGHVRINQDTTDTPGSLNTTAGFAFENANCLYISRANASPTLQLNSNSNGGEMIIFRKSGIEQGSIEIQSDGSGIVIAGESDYRLKENIVDIDDGITRLKKLKPKRYNFIKAKEDNPKSFNTYDGFLAHEVFEVCPEAVIGEKDGEKMQKLDPTKLITVTVAALQELITRVEALEAK
tara:strand:+ start:8291 stop:9859 length:1569 start_codon:yes stop_codon:yes gene_type:complete